MKQKTTMASLAEELGLDKSTICRALNNDPKIREETRARILKLADERGYQRNPGLTALSDMRWRKHANRAIMNWGFLITELALRYDENRIFFEQVRAYAKQAGYAVDRIVLHPDTSGKELRKIAEARNLRGLIINQIYLREAMRSLEPADFNQLNLFRVYCGNFYFEPEDFRVVENVFDHTLMALKQAYALGYRRIALLYQEHMKHSRDMVRQRAAALEFQYIQPDMRVQLVEVTRQDPLRGCKGKLKDCDALLIAHNFSYGAFPQWAKQLPYAYLRLEPNSKTTSGVSRVVDVMARTAVEVLNYQCRSQLLGDPSHPHCILVKGRWQAGETLPPKGK